MMTFSAFASVNEFHEITVANYLEFVPVLF
jgi:hypothetical protein